MDNFKSAVILAGGKSSRMKFDKQCLVINEKKLIFEICEKLEKHFEDIIIVSNKKEYYKDCKYKVVSDEIKEVGPLGGMAVGLKESISEYVYFIACDMPHIDDKYIKYMKNKIEKDIESNVGFDMYICNVGGNIQFFQGFYKKELEESINNYLIYGSRRSIKSFCEQSNKKIKIIEEDEFKEQNFKEDIFINLNTQVDLNLYKNNL